MPSRSDGETEQEMEGLSALVPRIHMEELRAEANRLSSPQKRVSTAVVVRTIISEWYQNRKVSK